ncbi:thioredoxin family protein [Aquibacillus rhizosphaerae]|uniref:Thioredoxin family protein n=1 Tax=Aquibacillus rhizosphaerae TaxID=3051431 RepID=A0ABT7LA72_9BACI|nr:thioredoxin family protein [Aquibacillus sp. LR5S19]MDL4842772.1 thioredoxin family protein [Aquibacillus sp. LR5S19]
MIKKMILFTLVIVLIIGALIFVINSKNNDKLEGNPYGKDNLDQATIDQLDNENYQNQILPDELEDKLANNEDVTVYFYSPTCVYCRNTTPIVVPLAEEMGIDLKKLNLLEFKVPEYSIESTPTLIHFEDGEEVSRIVGQHPKENFEQFFNDHVVE